MLKEGAEIRALAETHPLRMPVLAIGSGGGGFTAATMRNAGVADLRPEIIEGVGHYAAMEAPAKVAEFILAFVNDALAR